MPKKSTTRNTRTKGQQARMEKVVPAPVDGIGVAAVWTLREDCPSVRGRRTPDGVLVAGRLKSRTDG